MLAICERRRPLVCKFGPCPCERCRSMRDCKQMDREQYCTKQLNAMAVKRNFGDFITETGAVIAFFIVTTSMFWVWVTQWFLRLLMLLYRSKRRTQQFVFVVLAIILIASTYTNIRNTMHRRCNRAGDKINQCCRYIKTSHSKENEIKYDDATVKDIFHRTKLYSIPSEMKTPPPILFYIKDFIAQYRRV